MSYDAARSYLLGTINETASRRLPNRLDRMRLLLDRLGNPQEAYSTVHVGGTSGKGSTATMIAAALSERLVRVGLHTKPHLNSMTERARINGIPIAEDVFADTLFEMMPAIEATAAVEGRPTYYETLLALTLEWFAQCHVDAGVVEVGLGGTLDGTNVIVPKVCVITNSGIDHTDVLGETIEEIAADEAGIAKPGVPLITAALVPEARETIREACERAGAPFIHVDDVATIAGRPSEPYGQSFAVTTAADTYELSLPVLGRFQQRNAATAIVALEQLPPELRPSRDQVETALSRLVIPGRMEFYPAHPSVVFDVAHNRDKAQALAGALAETFPNRYFRFVIAVGESKDPQRRVAAVLRAGGSVYVHVLSNTRTQRDPSAALGADRGGLRRVGPCNRRSCRSADGRAPRSRRVGRHRRHRLDVRGRRRCANGGSRMSLRAQHAREPLALRDRKLTWGERTYVMGIVNASPDSFSGDGFADAAPAVEHAIAQRQTGADLSTSGAESTRPGTCRSMSAKNCAAVARDRGVRARASRGCHLGRHVQAGRACGRRTPRAPTCSIPSGGSTKRC